MKTNVIAVKNSGTGMEAALNEAERFAQYQYFNRQETLRVRLLAEEMMSFVTSIVGDFYAIFWVEGEGKEARLCLEADAKVDFDRREQLLELSTSGKNAAHRTFMGKLVGIFEYCMMSYDTSVKYGGDYADFMFDDVPNYGYERMWSLKAMRESLDGSEAGSGENAEKRDDLEKSIVASLADEVLVGVRSHKVQLIIKKTF